MVLTSHQHCSKNTILTTALGARYSYCVHFIDAETKANRGEVTCSRLHQQVLPSPTECPVIITRTVIVVAIVTTAKANIY